MSDASLKSEMKTAANHAAETVKDAATAQADATRDAISDQIEDAGDAARAASQQFPDDTLQAEALRIAADKIGTWSAQLQGKPIEELANDAALLARRHPLLVLGGAAAVGFAAARFLKATDPASEPERPTDPWRGHLHAGSAEQEAPHDTA